jgi:hypothetical protein
MKTNKYKRKGNLVYASWAAMMRRCYNRSSRDYKYYGGRGITVCSRWLMYENFYDDMSNGFKVGLTLDRINNNKNYYQENCRWATRKEQCQNRRTSNRIIDENTGKPETISSLALKYFISRNTITSRIRLGYTSFKDLVARKLPRWNEIIIKNPKTEQSKNISEWVKIYKLKNATIQKRYTMGIVSFNKLFSKHDLRRSKL